LAKLFGAKNGGLTAGRFFVHTYTSSTVAADFLTTCCYRPHTCRLITLPSDTHTHTIYNYSHNQDPSSTPLQASTADLVSSRTTQEFSYAVADGIVTRMQLLLS